MLWKKTGRIFSVQGQYPWMQTHAQVPTADVLTSNLIRIYFGTRDKEQRTATTFIDLRTDPTLSIVALHNRPVLGLGSMGAFDDSGAMPSWIVNHRGEKYLFYTGWNTGKTVPYRNAIGLAVSDDGGRSFIRFCSGPVLDRCPSEPYFCSQPCVMIDRGCWRMWYMSCVGWHVINGRPEPRYNIKYAESNDGIHWAPQSITCIDFKSTDEGGIARPCVTKTNDGYDMWYSYRKLEDYRRNPANSYRIGYARSTDGLHWQRQDEGAGIDASLHGWDSQMIAYPFVLTHENRRYLFYNGNGFGQTGFGCAIQHLGQKLVLPDNESPKHQ